MSRSLAGLPVSEIDKREKSMKMMPDLSGMKLHDPELLVTLAAAKGRRLTPDEIREQRVSWVFGMLSPDDPRTKDDIRRSLQEQGL
jgi:hypothetical protein